ncbi:MAG: alpha/beta hydrolase [Desulfobacteraceae bacterium]|nr:alpha/beta hydrolase [Desulfobacteraceae bacterium]
MNARIFIHGLESGNQGTKSIFFRERYPDMIIPNFTGDLQKRMEKLRGVLSGKSGIRLVGSSFGGLMASLFALEQEARVERMVLLAPAINITEFAHHKGKKVAIPVWVYHGTGDQVIPLGEVEAVAKACFENLSFHVVEDDHFLHTTFKTIDWERLLA